MNGEGYYRWADGRTYNGEFKDNEMHGNGTYEWADKRVYVGQFINDKREGHGVLTWPDGQKKYEGSWKDGKQDGEGKLISLAKGKVKNIKHGLWQNGKLVKWINK